MNREILTFCDLQVIDVVALPHGERIVHTSPYATPGFPMGKDWPDIELANHNVFRLNAQNEVVWQVKRVENPGTPDWPTQHEMAKKWKREGLIDGAYTEQGYLDPFTSLSMDERPALAPEPQGVWRPGCVVYLLTRWWSYVLDPETGIATCTGDQVK